MRPTILQMYQWFDEINEQVFCGEMPRVRITFTNTRRQLGQFYWGGGRGIGIKISLYYDRTEEQYRNSLLHEMCHLYCYNRGWIHEHHGERWKMIAAYATRVTGLLIQRCEDITGWKVSDENGASSPTFPVALSTDRIMRQEAERKYLLLIFAPGNDSSLI